MRAFKFLLSLFAVLALVAATPKKDWKDVEEALGRAGSVLPGGVYKVSFPRSDLAVTAVDLEAPPVVLVPLPAARRLDHSVERVEPFGRLAAVDVGELMD